MNADFREAKLERANFYSANLQGAYLKGASVKCADLTYTVLKGIYYDNISFLDIENNLDYDNLTKIERTSSFESVKNNIKLAK
ncbi:MAG: pentapeptide repeat-containing protein [Nitrospirae bacterium]|nr:pentapeptide repeat-containing protein [Nitrospirota bacterium]MBF0519443.1 pentapeptide repeat-containing protein [Nitrospirota bacterium]MBF0534799.1 pentapeptide repeat-containing protein [Nitrospirota bacterium]MBF0616473.1 pentapeptide repeat-containing protein [Nitrospirota bacterium]